MWSTVKLVNAVIFSRHGFTSSSRSMQSVHQGQIIVHILQIQNSFGIVCSVCLKGPGSNYSFIQLSSDFSIYSVLHARKKFTELHYIEFSIDK